MVIIYPSRIRIIGLDRRHRRFESNFTRLLKMNLKWYIIMFTIICARHVIITLSVSSNFVPTLLDIHTSERLEYSNVQTSSYHALK